MTNEAQIKSHIAEFVNELNLLVRKNLLENLLAALEGGAAPAARRAPRTQRRAARGGGNVEDAAAKILDHVKANDGQGIGEIASATGLPLPLAKKAALHLLASGSIRKTGQRRGTKYHAGGGKARPAKAGKRRAKKAARKAKRRTRKPARKPMKRRAKKAATKAIKRSSKPTARRAAPSKRKAAKKETNRPGKKRPNPAPQAAAEATPEPAAAE